MGNTCAPGEDETFEAIRAEFDIDLLYCKVEAEKSFRDLYQGKFKSIDFKKALVEFIAPHSFFAVQSEVGMLLVHQGEEKFSKEDVEGKSY